MALPLDPPRRIVQQITAAWSGHKETMLCILELDKRHIAIAGLSNAGMSLFSLSFDGKKTVLDKSPLLPDSISPEFIIKDLQLAYWPLAKLQKILPYQWRLEDNRHHRRLYFNNNLQAEVDYLQPDNVWAKLVTLNNHRYQYKLSIKTLSYETLSE